MTDKNHAWWYVLNAGGMTKQAKKLKFRPKKKPKQWLI